MSEGAPRGGLAALCAAQITSWGLLYYSLPVAVEPISRETGWSHVLITGAFSAGLVISALAGIRVGRILDTRGPRTVMTAGSVLGVFSLLLVAWSPSLSVFVLAWLLAGFAQSAVLYPPAFAVITRWYGERRVGPLTTLTLVGGFASTVYAPLVAWSLERFGWQLSYVFMAVVLAVVTVPLHALFLNRHWVDGETAPAKNAEARPAENGEAAGHRDDAGSAPAKAMDTRGEIRAITHSRTFVLLQIVMAIAMFTLFAVTINVIPLFLERGIDYSASALALGLIGVGQVVGRIGYPQLSRRTSARTRTVLFIGLGAVGLWGLALLPGPFWLLVAVGLLVGGVRGCNTLLQATAVSDRWGTKNFGTINGIFTAPMTILGALAPVAGPVLADLLGGYPAMAAAAAGLLTLAALLALRSSPAQ